MQTNQSNQSLNYSKYIAPLVAFGALGTTLYYSYKWFCPSAKKPYMPKEVTVEPSTTFPDINLEMKSPKKNIESTETTNTTAADSTQ